MMSLTLICLLFTVVILLYIYVRRLYTYWERRGIPHERPIFPLGHVKDVGSKLHLRDVNSRIYTLFKGKTPLTGMYLAFKKAAMILDLELVKDILIKDFGNFHDRGLFSNPRDDPLSGHLFMLDGEQWRSLRTKLTPVFTSGKMKFMFKTIVGVSENLINCCESLMDADGNGDVDLKELCSRYTTDVIGTCAFGLDCNSLKNADAEFRQMGKAIFTKIPNRLLQIFIITFPKLACAMHLKFFADDVTKFFINTVRSTVEYRIKNNIKRNDFMDILIEMKAENEDISRNTNGIDLSQGLTLEQMAAQAFVFFFAGFETSSTTMAFCLYELAANEDIQMKLREEINSVLKKHNGELTYEAMNEMVFLDHILNETLRKYSVLPQLIRVSKSDYKIPNSNYVIEAGTQIIIPVASIQLDPEYYPNPEKFDPSRFDPEEVAKRPPMSFLPFGDGPRNCIGLRFGKMQSKVGLINLLKHYKFSKSPKLKEPIEFDVRAFIISSKNGIFLKLEKI